MRPQQGCSEERPTPAQRRMRSRVKDSTIGIGIPATCHRNNECIGISKSMEELEEKIQRLVQKITGQLLEWSLNEMDARLAKDMDPGKYENKGIRSRTLVTTVGEIEIKRRYYRELETGRNCFLLDETLGLAPRKRISPRLEKMMLDMGTETTFRKASTLLEYLVPGVSHMTVWSEVQRAGARAKKKRKKFALKYSKTE